MARGCVHVPNVSGMHTEEDFGERAAKHDRGIEIRRGLRLVDVGTGIGGGRVRCCCRGLKLEGAFDGIF